MANVLSTSYHISKAALDEADLCEHLQQEATAQAYAIFKEDDSFGPVGRIAVCKVCYDKSIQEHNEQTTCCNDCKQMKKNSEMREWRWYDFYAPQGDEPLEICTDCWKEPKHQERMRKDNQARKEEEAYYKRTSYYSDDYDTQDDVVSNPCRICSAEMLPSGVNGVCSFCKDS